MYAKVFVQIFDSSIVENPEVRLTFMDMLILADADGVVDMTHEAIARRTNRPEDVVRRTIAALEAPDKKSRSATSDGRRIVRLDKHRDWGWMIVNYGRFRDIVRDEQRRAKTRARVARFRHKHGEKRECNADVTPPNARNAKQKQKKKEKQRQKKKQSPRRSTAVVSILTAPLCSSAPSGGAATTRTETARDAQPGSAVGKTENGKDTTDPALTLSKEVAIALGRTPIIGRDGRVAVSTQLKADLRQLYQMAKDAIEAWGEEEADYALMEKARELGKDSTILVKMAAYKAWWKKHGPG